MEKFLTFLNGNPWLNIVFLILAVLSILISFILYFRSKREKSPRYNIKHFNLVRGRLKELKSVKISYGDEPVEDLTLTRFAFWNKGRETIEQRDLAPADPLRISVPEGYRILEANIDYTHNPINNINVKLSEDKRDVLVQFDYIDTFEGCVLTIYHTAVGSDVNVLGTIKGAGKVKKGVVERDHLANTLIDSTIRKVVPKDPSNIIGKLSKRIIIYISAIFIAPIAVILQPADLIISLMRSSPPQFTLEDTE